MSYLFISHSSKNDFEAIALQNWLVREGWDEIFLDLNPERGIVAGERWEQALHEAANRCDAVLFLVSKAWLDSEWCRKEFRLAHRFNKRIIGLLIEDLAIESLPEELTAHWQLLNLAAGLDQEVFETTHPKTETKKEVRFSRGELLRLRSGLIKAGLDPRHFEWPPVDDLQRPPYRGMRPLEAEDAGIFFGREASTIDLLARLRGLREDPSPRFLVILGASGAGKSSFLRAGILPRLIRDDRHFLPLPIIRPGQSALWGDDGLLASLTQSFNTKNVELNHNAIRDAIEQNVEALAQCLQALAAAAELPAVPGEQSTPPTIVLSIDQGEELFQSEGREEAQLLLKRLQQLAHRPDLPLIILFTIRSDAYERLQTAKDLEGIQQQTFSLAPMPKGAYQNVIEGPALRLKNSKRPLKVEPGLTHQLLEDLDKGGSKDALPLLAFTLERLYLDYGDDGDLRLDEYQDMGGIEGAIEAAVKDAFNKAEHDPRLPKDRKALLALMRRGLIPWLAGIDLETQAPKRRVAHLHEIPEEARPIVDHLIQQRLLATDVDQNTQETTLEPAHEALLRQWSLLDGWLKEDFAALTTLEAVKQAARDWEANLRGEDWLSHSAGRLEDAESLKQREDLSGSLTHSDWDYLKSCRERENALRNQALEEAQNLAEALKREAEAQGSAARRTRIGLLVSLILTVITSLMGWQAWERTEVAESKTRIAEQRTEEAQAATQEAKAQRNKALLTESRFLIDLARQHNEQGHFDTALLLGLNAIPGIHGGDRPMPDSYYALNQAIVQSTKRAVFQHDGDVISATFSPDGQSILTASSDNTAALWNAQSGEKGLTFQHDKLVSSATFSPDGQSILTSSWDKTAALWDAQTGEKLRTFQHNDSVISATFSPDGQSILTSSWDKTAALWPAQIGEKRHTFLHNESVISATFSSDGQAILTASDDLTAALWDTQTGEKRLTFQHNDSVISATFSPDGQSILTASDDRTAALWDAHTGKKRHTFQHDRRVISATFSPDGQSVLTASSDNTAALWDAQTGEKWRTFQHDRSVISATFSPDGQSVLTASFGHTAALWDAQTGEKRRIFQHDSAVQSATFSPDGQFVLTASFDQTAALWDAQTGEKWRIFQHDRSVISATFSPDGQSVLTASFDQTAALWRAQTGEKRHTFQHDRRVFSATFSPDGQSIVTASSDNTAALWDSQTGEKRRTFQHNDTVYSATFSPDGQSILTGSWDNTAALWPTPPITLEALQKAALQKLPLNRICLSQEERKQFFLGELTNDERRQRGCGQLVQPTGDTP